MQHDHLIDLNTGKVIEFCDPRIDEIIRTACELNNFDPSHHSLYIYGRRKRTSRDDQKQFLIFVNAKSLFLRDFFYLYP